MIVDDLDDFHCKWVNDILKRIMLKHGYMVVILSHGSSELRGQPLHKSWENPPRQCGKPT